MDCWLTLFLVILFKLLISFLCLAAFVSQLSHLLNWECSSLKWASKTSPTALKLKGQQPLPGSCDDQTMQNCIKCLAECNSQRRCSVNISAPAPVWKHVSWWYTPWLDYLFAEFFITSEFKPCYALIPKYVGKMHISWRTCGFTLGSVCPCRSTWFTPGWMAQILNYWRNCSKSENRWRRSRKQWGKTDCQKTKHKKFYNYN